MLLVALSYLIQVQDKVAAMRLSEKIDAADVTKALFVVSTIALRYPQLQWWTAEVMNIPLLLHSIR